MLTYLQVPFYWLVSWLFELEMGRAKEGWYFCSHAYTKEPHLHLRPPCGVGETPHKAWLSMTEDFGKKGCTLTKREA